MCTSYSGRCVLSNYVTNRDSNRGGCSQVCRFSFSMDDNNDYQICSKDLSMIDYVEDLVKLGVASLKIEGRMRSLYYIATVVNAYKSIVTLVNEGNLSEDDILYYKKVLSRVSNRDNVPQFFDKEPLVDEQYYTGRQEVSNQDFLALVISDEEDGYAIIEQRNNFKVGDTVEVFGPDTKARKFEVEEFINDKLESVNEAKHPQERLKIKVPFKVRKYDIIRVPILLTK